MSKYSDKKFDESKPKKIREEDDKKDSGNTVTAGLEDNREQTNIAASLALQASESEHKEDGGVRVAHDLKSNNNIAAAELDPKALSSMTSVTEDNEEDAKTMEHESASTRLDKNIMEEKEEV